MLFLRAMAAVLDAQGIALLDGRVRLWPRAGWRLPRARRWPGRRVYSSRHRPVAAVGLWLAAPWGAVVWLTASVSMVVVEVFFPQMYGDLMIVFRDPDWSHRGLSRTCNYGGA